VETSRAVSQTCYDKYGAVTTRGATYGASGLSFSCTYDDFGRLRRVSENENGTVFPKWHTYDNAGRFCGVCSFATCLAVDGLATARWTYQGIHPVAEYNASNGSLDL
jgi:hypothetical protein